MSLLHLLEDFGGTRGAAGSHPAPNDEEIETRRLAAFEEGYQAGWDDALHAHTQDRMRLTSDLAQNLLDMSFTYNEAYTHLFRELRPLLIERGQDIAQVGLGAEPHLGLGQPQPLRPHPHLCAGLFARDVDGFQPGARKARGGLQQQGRFADAGIAADQDRAAGHQSATQNPVQFRHPRDAARRRRLVGGKTRQRNAAPLGRAQTAPRLAPFTNASWRIEADDLTIRGFAPSTKGNTTPSLTRFWQPKKRRFTIGKKTRLISRAACRSR